jgi:hypothetical protein
MKIYNKGIQDWDKFPEYNMIWTDPPWGQRMVRFFYTKMYGKGHSEKVDDIKDILKALSDNADNQKPMFIAYCVAEYKNILPIFARHKLNQILIANQENGRPFVIISYNTNYKMKEGLKGFDNVRDCIFDLQPNTVFDPFSGIGKTARIVEKAGANYIGSEININRYKQSL